MAFYCHKGLEGYSRDPGLNQSAVRDTGFDKNSAGFGKTRHYFWIWNWPLPRKRSLTEILAPDEVLGKKTVFGIEMTKGRDSGLS